MLNVVCVNWGLKFKPEYTKNLYSMVQRHLTIPHKFICYTNSMKLQKVVKADNFEVRNAKKITIQIKKKNKINLLYDKRTILHKKILMEKLRNS